MRVIYIVYWHWQMRVVLPHTLYHIPYSQHAPYPANQAHALVMATYTLHTLAQALLRRMNGRAGGYNLTPLDEVGARSWS